MDDEEEQINWREPVHGQPAWWFHYMERMSMIAVQYAEVVDIEIRDFYANLYHKDTNNLVYPTGDFRTKANRRRQTQLRSKNRDTNWTVPSFPASLYKLFEPNDIIDRLYTEVNGVEPPREEENIETPPTMTTRRPPVLRTPPPTTGARVRINDPADDAVDQLSTQFEQTQVGPHRPPTEEFITRVEKVQLVFGYQLLIAGLMIYMNEAGRVTDDGRGRKNTVCFEQTMHNWDDRELVSSLNLVYV